jgi:hypothetical protein
VREEAGMEDHDQRMKVLLREFFVEFMRLFCPLWAARLDFATVAWLEKEIFPDPPRGERRAVDLLARVATSEPAWPLPFRDLLALVHLEVESAEKVAVFRKRMYDYYHYLSRLHNLPVLPVAVYLRVGLEGLGWDTYEEYVWEDRVVHFTYRYIGLPGLDAEQYVRQDNWLGVALSALMRMPAERRLDLGQDAWRRLIRCPENAHRRYLLCECVDAYLPLDEEQRRTYQQKILTDPDPGVRTMSMTLFEKFKQEGRAEGRAEGHAEGRAEGHAEGRAEGHAEGQRDALLLMLGTRFGVLSPEVKERVAALPAEKVTEIFVAALKAQTLEELGLAG